jgi:undecaprenyl-diphosphatase
MDISQTPQWIQAIILGLVQGLTEFLPISSSAHLILVPELTGWSYMGKAFDVSLNVGTLAATIVYFWSDIKHLLTATLEIAQGKPWKEDENRRLVIWLILASIPAGFLGFIFEKKIDATFGTVPTIALFLGLFGILLGVAERFGSREFEVKHIKAGPALLIGCAQAVALMPGVSRSGSTMTACLLLGLKRAEAARFSFLMALPITTAATALKLVKLFKQMAETHDYSAGAPCLVGIIVSGISGWFCIHYLLRYIRTQSFIPFTIYRLVLSCFLFLYWLTHRG